MLALFKSLKIGPLAIVAPIIGIYPIISLILAYLAGAEIRLIFWPLVFFVVLGSFTERSLLDVSYRAEPFSVV